MHSIIKDLLLLKLKRIDKFKKKNYRIIIQRAYGNNTMFQQVVTDESYHIRPVLLSIALEDIHCPTRFFIDQPCGRTSKKDFPRWGVVDPHFT